MFCTVSSDLWNIVLNTVATFPWLPIVLQYSLSQENVKPKGAWRTPELSDTWATRYSLQNTYFFLISPVQQCKFSNIWQVAFPELCNCKEMNCFPENERRTVTSSDVSWHLMNVYVIKYYRFWCSNQNFKGRFTILILWWFQASIFVTLIILLFAIIIKLFMGRTGRGKRKCSLGYMLTAKVQISLRFSADWSGPSLSAYWIVGYCRMYQRKVDSGERSMTKDNLYLLI